MADNMALMLLGFKNYDRFSVRKHRPDEVIRG